MNKIDLISGWHSNPELQLIKNINSQSDYVKGQIEKRLYELVGRLSELSFNSERFDRVEDFTKQITIIPISAKTSEGIPELLMVLTGLAQKFLESSLKTEAEGPAKGTILEIKEEKGLGLTLDVILYDGTLKINDQIVIGSLDEPIVTKVKALFEPENKKLKSVKEVTAATGVKIIAPNIENALAGMPLISAKDIKEVDITATTDSSVLKDADYILVIVRSMPLSPF